MNTGADEGAEAGGRLDTEHWVMKRQQQRARKAEEAVKNKRTVFVGNLPASCTKKVRQGFLSIYLSMQSSDRCPSLQPSADKGLIVLFVSPPDADERLQG